MMHKICLALTAGALVLSLCGIVYADTIKMYGEISAIDYAARTIEVAGVTIYTTDATAILICGEAATFADLQLGQTVQVVGTVVDGQFIAKCICIQGKQTNRPDDSPGWM